MESFMLLYFISVGRIISSLSSEWLIVRVQVRGSWERTQAEEDVESKACYCNRWLREKR